MPTRIPVVLDIGPAVHQRAGLSRYTERLAATLLEGYQEQIDLRLVYNAHSGHRPPPTLQAAPTHTLPLGQYPWRLSVLASQLAQLPYAPLLPLLRPRGPSPTVYHATEHLLPYLPGPTVLTVHDLIFERYPQHHTLTNRLFLRLAMPRFVRAARRIIAVSRHTAHDLEMLYGVDAGRVSVIYEGVDARFHPVSPEERAEVRSRYSPDRPYLLMVGTLEPRKNHALALAALARLKAAGYPHRLVIGGAQGWLFEPVRQRVAELGLVDDVNFAGYVPAGDLPGLYGGADCVLFPSLYEGFGLPVLEAMACGAPVVCAATSSLPEVAGDAALIAPVHDEEAFTAAIVLILSQPAVADTLRRRGIQRAQEFTWARCARQTIEVYREAARLG